MCQLMPGSFRLPNGRIEPLSSAKQVCGFRYEINLRQPPSGSEHVIMERIQIDYSQLSGALPPECFEHFLHDRRAKWIEHP